MAELSIGDAVGSGFELIGQRPMAVMSWGLVELLFAVSLFALFGSMYLEVFSQFLSNARAAAGQTTSITMGTPLTMMTRMAQLQGANLLINLGGLAVRSIIACAVFRAVLHPDQIRFGYLRLGTAELFVALLTVGMVIAAVAGIVLPLLVIVLVSGILFAFHAVALGVIVGSLGGIALAVVLVYAALRLSVAAPMIVHDNRFHLFDAWALTRRHAGKLFVISICVVAILLAANLVIGLVTLLTGMGVVGAMAGGVSNLPTFFNHPFAQIVGSLGPLLLVAGLISIPLSGCAHAISYAPWARAYRDLAGPDMAATFS